MTYMWVRKGTGSLQATPRYPPNVGQLLLENFDEFDNAERKLEIECGNWTECDRLGEQSAHNRRPFVPLICMCQPAMRNYVIQIRLERKRDEDCKKRIHT
jgi:hypothetical protein